jgi:hypothetical protein
MMVNRVYKLFYRLMTFFNTSCFLLLAFEIVKRNKANQRSYYSELSSSSTSSSSHTSELIEGIIKSCADQQVLETGRQSVSQISIADKKGQITDVEVTKVKTLLLFFGYGECERRLFLILLSTLTKSFVGTGRSGHSLIAALLDSHPSIAIGKN